MALQQLRTIVFKWNLKRKDNNLRGNLKRLLIGILEGIINVKDDFLI